MRYTFAALAVLLMTGCANTSKTAAIPDTGQVRESPSQPAATPATNASASAVPGDASRVAEAKHDELDTLVKGSANLKTSYQGFEPYQCVMAWTKGVQQNLNPWLKTCDTSTQKN